MFTCCSPSNKTKPLQASLFRADPSHSSKPDSALCREEPAGTAPCPSLAHPPNALAHRCAAARLHRLLPGGNSTRSNLSVDTSSRHWKCRMRNSLLGRKQEQQPKESGEQLIFETHESRRKCLLGPSNKLDNTSTYSSSTSYFTKCCFSATNCSLWEKPRFNLQQEGCLTIMQGPL